MWSTLTLFILKWCPFIVCGHVWSVVARWAEQWSAWHWTRVSVMSLVSPQDTPRGMQNTDASISEQTDLLCHCACEVQGTSQSNVSTLKHTLTTISTEASSTTLEKSDRGLHSEITKKTRFTSVRVFDRLELNTTCRDAHAIWVGEDKWNEANLDLRHRRWRCRVLLCHMFGSPIPQL